MEYCRFFSPRSIYHGAGALQSLATVSCRRALITTDRAIRALGMVERVERILQANGAVTRIFDQVEAEPSKETAIASGAALEPRVEQVFNHLKTATGQHGWLVQNICAS